MTSTNTTGHQVTTPELQVADYVVFSLVLCVSAAIGLYYIVKAWRGASAEEMMTGQRRLPLIPVTFSLSVSFVSAVSVLGIPSEIYYRGPDYWFVGVGLLWSLLFVGLVILPKMYRLNLTSVYEYLELRFNKTIRYMASLTFIFLMISYMAVALYAPALALSQVTGLSMQVSILTISVICTVYTALGGIRAVIWTDAFQTVIITVGLVTLLWRGADMAGGVARVYDVEVAARRQGDHWNFDPFIRHTFWTLCIGGGFGNVAIHGANQATMQRYMSVDSLKKTKIMMVLNLLLSELYLALLCLCGVVMAAYYKTGPGDPMKGGRIKNTDQVLPIFVMDVMGDYPGLPGLFVAAVFSAALSTVSSGVNSLAIVTVKDLISPALVYWRGSLPQDTGMARIVKGTALGYGVLTIAMAYLCGQLSATLLYLTVSVFGIMGGPLLGVILLGLFCPWVNSWGAGAALVSSLAMCMWTGVGNIVRSVPDKVFNATSNTTTYVYADREPIHALYDLSYQHYASEALLVCLIVGSLVSCITSCNKGRKLRPDTYYDIIGCCRSLIKRYIQKEPDHVKHIELVEPVQTDDGPLDKLDTSSDACVKEELSNSPTSKVDSQMIQRRKSGAPAVC